MIWRFKSYICMHYILEELSRLREFTGYMLLNAFIKSKYNMLVFIHSFIYWCYPGLFYSYFLIVVSTIVVITSSQSQPLPLLPVSYERINLNEYFYSEELVVGGSCLVYPGIRLGQTPLTLAQVKARMSCLQVHFIRHPFCRWKYRGYILPKGWKGFLILFPRYYQKFIFHPLLLNMKET